MVSQNKRILCISDIHAPFEHPDTLAFLTAVKAKYKPDRVVFLGDEADNHALSFHDSDPDLDAAGAELRITIDHLKPFYKLFPEADLLDSNHGSLPFRKALHHGIPKKYLRTLQDVLEAPKKWRWHDRLILTMSNGQKVFFHHGLKRNGVQVAQQMGMCVVQGHFHSAFNIVYTSSPALLNWSMQVGCSIDDHMRAFAYNKLTLERPILGHGIVLDGIPRLLPMIIGANGRWNKFVP